MRNFNLFDLIVALIIFCSARLAYLLIKSARKVKATPVKPVSETAPAPKEMVVRRGETNKLMGHTKDGREIRASMPADGRSASLSIGGW